MPSPYQFALSDGCPARAVRVEQWQELADAIATLGLATARPTLVLVGGASKISPTDYARLQHNDRARPLIASGSIRAIDLRDDLEVLERTIRQLLATSPSSSRS